MSSRRRAPAGEPPSGGSAGVDAEPDHEQVARAIVLRLLTGAPRSRAQLGEALARRDVPPDVAGRVLDRFTEVGLIDDGEYARMLVRSKHAERGLSRRALVSELRRRGIDDETAGQALASIDDEAELDAARHLVERVLRGNAGLPREVRMRRTLASLGRRGHAPGLVSRLVREALAAETAGAPGFDDVGEADADPDLDDRRPIED